MFEIELTIENTEHVVDGVISAYNSGTKVASIVKDSDGTPGWDNFHHSNAVEATLDATTAYSNWTWDGSKSQGDRMSD